jgi:DNA repair protein RadD
MAYLRKYQEEALEAITCDIDTPGNSIVVLPTGAGKSHLIAASAMLRRPVLILVPSRELLLQNRDKLAAVVPESEIGIYSASFLKMEINTFTIATIQSVYKHPELFRDTKLVIIDECHQVNPKALGSMYTSFLKAIGSPKVIGMTATMFRLETVYEKVGNELYAATGIKMINRMLLKGSRESFWKRILYVKSHAELVQDGFLCPLEYINEPLVPYESIPVNISHSDFNLSSYSQMVIGMEAQILNTIAEAQRRYKHVLIFCSETGQAKRLSEIVKGSRFVLGDSDKKTRAKIIEEFKSGEVQTVFNVGCLTTGFDLPELDCIILLRPVRSPILYAQMLGRGSRIAPGKTHCTVIDLTGSCKEIGPIESFEVFLNRGLWDVRTSKVDGFHGRLLFRQKIQ